MYMEKVQFFLFNIYLHEYPVLCQTLFVLTLLWLVWLKSIHGRNGNWRVTIDLKILIFINTQNLVEISLFNVWMYVGNKASPSMVPFYKTQDRWCQVRVPKNKTLLSLKAVLWMMTMVKCDDFRIEFGSPYLFVRRSILLTA